MLNLSRLTPLVLLRKTQRFAHFHEWRFLYRSTFLNFCFLLANKYLRRQIIIHNKTTYKYKGGGSGGISVIPWYLDTWYFFLSPARRCCECFFEKSPKKNGKKRNFSIFSGYYIYRGPSERSAFPQRRRPLRRQTSESSEASSEFPEVRSLITLLSRHQYNSLLNQRISTRHLAISKMVFMPLIFSPLTRARSWRTFVRQTAA